MRYLISSLLLWNAVSAQAAELPLTGSLEVKTVCLKYNFIEKSLGREGEHITVSLLSDKNKLIEIWMDPKTEEWTVVSRDIKLKIGCILSVGFGYYKTLGTAL